MSRARGALRPLLEHVLGAVLVAVAATPWLAVTGTRPGVLHLGVAVVGATLVSVVLTRLRRVEVATETLLSAVVLAGVLLVVVVGDPTGGSDVLRGLRDGIPRALSTSLPLLDVPWAGVPGAVVVWAAAAVVASTTARRRGVAASVLAALAVFLGGYTVTLGGQPGDVATAATTEGLMLALVAGAYCVVRSYRTLPGEEPAVRLIRLSGAGLTVVTAVALGAVAAELGPFVADEPVRPRLSPAAAELEPDGPLLVTRRLREDEPDRPVARVRVGGEWSGYVPIAVLDRYDGRSWSRTDDRLLPTGGQLPVSLPAPPGPDVVVSDLDVAATGGWLPYVGRVATISGAPVVQDDGEVFRLAEPVARPTYRLDTAQPARSIEDEDLGGDQPTARGSGLVRPLEVVRLAGDQRVSGERVCRLLALTAGGSAPDPGTELTVRGAPCSGRAPDQVAFVRGLADELSTGRAVAVRTEDGASAGGPESLADLLELVGPPAADGRSTGAPEQFAAAFTLMADNYGLPVRLVTGFRVEEPAAGETHELHGRDAWTWAEVAVDGVGWVAVDPTPSAEDVAPEEELRTPEELERPDPTPQEAPAELGVQAETVTVGPPPPPEERDATSVLLAVLVGVGCLLVVPLIVAGLRRAVRRRRRRRGDARARTIGAWHHLLEVAHEAGVEDVPSRTTAELVDLLAGRLPRSADELAALPPIVDRALYSSRSVGAEEATRAWTVVREARAALRRGMPRRVRVANAWRVPPRTVTRGPRRRRRRRAAEPAPLLPPVRPGGSGRRRRARARVR